MILRSPLRRLAAGALAGLLGLGTAPAFAAPPEPVTALGPGMVGVFYPPPPGHRDVVLVLGGSEGGSRGSAPLARKLAEHGFGALALAYFGAPGLPALLEDVPLESMGAAVSWLRAQPTIGARPIAVVGVSKGAEAALLLASHDARLCAVVAGSPSSVVWAGINTANPAIPATTSSWSVAGKPVPFAPYVSGPFRGVLHLYEESLAKAPPQAAIPVERIRGPVLFVSGKDDRLWPSTPMAEAAMARLEAAHFAYPHRHIAYDQAGHAVFGAPLAADSPALKSLGDMGGTSQGNQAARTDGWPKTLAFLDAAFAGKSCAAEGKTRR